MVSAEGLHGQKKGGQHAFLQHAALLFFVLKIPEILLHGDEEVVLLSFLCQEVLAVDEIVAGDGALLVG